MKRIVYTSILSILLATTAFAQKTEVIAHRGVWENNVLQQNTLTSLAKAQDLNIYGCELDVNLTFDGFLVVCHGPEIGDIKNVQYANLAKVREVKLVNNETVPTFTEYLKAAKKHPETKLIVEIKPHDLTVLESDALHKVIKEVKREGMKKQVEFISFSFYICKELARLMPKSKVAYLGGDKTPKEVKEARLTGIDYNKSKLIENPTWIKEAHELGLSVNVWTVTNPDDIKMFRDKGVDYLTTNAPVEAKELCK